MEVVGREHELAAIERFVNGGDFPRALVLEGEAGIGKTTLWRAALVDAERAGYRVVACRPAGSEVRLSFSALSDLLEGELEEVLPTLPDPQRRALEVALLLADDGGRPPDERAIAAAVLNALRTLAREGPWWWPSTTRSGSTSLGCRDRVRGATPAPRAGRGIGLVPYGDRGTAPARARAGACAGSPDANRSGPPQPRRRAPPGYGPRGRLREPPHPAEDSRDLRRQPVLRRRAHAGAGAGRPPHRGAAGRSPQASTSCSGTGCRSSASRTGDALAVAPRHRSRRWSWSAPLSTLRLRTRCNRRSRTGSCAWPAA